MGSRDMVETVTANDPRVADVVAAVSALNSAPSSASSGSPALDLGRRARDEVLSFVQQAPFPFSRTADLHHVTASALVVSHRGVLLHRHKLWGIWLQPGGHIDGDESPADAARREVVEETGVVPVHPRGAPVLVNVDVHRIDNGHVHYDLQYLLHSAGEDPAPPPDESQDVGWFPAEEAVTMVDQPCRSLIEAGISPG